MFKKIGEWVEMFKKLEPVEKLIILVLLVLIVRLSWPLLQILYTVACNIFRMHGLIL